MTPPTPIPGLRVLTSPVHRDVRGSFTQAWSARDLAALGVEFAPVQHNLSVNVAAGVTRGFHAEPWTKLVTVAAGAVFGAWLDLRPGPGFGRVWWRDLVPGEAVLVPAGVANAFQAVVAGTVYSYLVDRAWRPGPHPAVNLADPALAVPWPIPLSEAVLSDADRQHPPLAQVAQLAQVAPVAPGAGMVILGGSGQLGRALRRVFPDAQAPSRAEVDLGSADSVLGFDWPIGGCVINAAAYTDVDGAETAAGRAEAWRVNVAGVGALAEASRRLDLRLVQISSDYVFDGVQRWHTDTEPVAPLGVYGQTKAAGEALVGVLPRQLVLRTSWLVGDGPNFVATMAGLARRGGRPRVVADQWGRLTFADDLADAVAHLLADPQRRGIFHVSADGPEQSWADVARAVFAASGQDPDAVTAVSTAEYGAAAPRPRHSGLDLTKVLATGYRPPDGTERLGEWLARLGGEAEPGGVDLRSRS